MVKELWVGQLRGIKMNKTIIIAEAGVNHNGDVDLAKKLVDAAVYAGADIIKFQSFKAEKITTKSAKKVGMPGMTNIYPIYMYFISSV